MKEPIFSTMDQEHQEEFETADQARYHFYDKRVKTRKKILFFHKKLTENLGKIGLSESLGILAGQVGPDLLEVLFIDIF